MSLYFESIWLNYLMKHSGGNQSLEWFNCLKILETERGKYTVFRFLKWRVNNLEKMRGYWKGTFLQKQEDVNKQSNINSYSLFSCHSIASIGIICFYSESVSVFLRLFFTVPQMWQQLSLPEELSRDPFNNDG